ncbi:MAG: Yip1 family protein [Thermoplasmatales archaeon]|nr:Yip1 family protein [Thermoplasmatales archaeon]
MIANVSCPRCRHMFSVDLPDTNRKYRTCCPKCRYEFDVGGVSYQAPPMPPPSMYGMPQPPAYMYGPPRKMGFFEKVKGFMFSPTNTFNNAKSDTLSESFKYFIILLLIYSSLSAAMMSAQIMLIGFISEEIFGFPVYGFPTADVLIVKMFEAFIMNIIYGIIGVFIGGAWLHLWVYVVGGRKGIAQTIKSCMYSATPSYLIGWIPCIGFIGSIWSLVLNVIGIKQLHEISTWRAVAAFILAVLPVIIITIVLAVLLYVWVSGFTGGI